MMSSRNASFRTPSLKLALLAVGFGLALNAGTAIEGHAASEKAYSAPVAQSIQVATRAKGVSIPTTKQGLKQAENIMIRAVRSNNPPSTQAISCDPKTFTDICPTGLDSICTHFGGGMSQNPDKSYTCSGPFTDPDG